MTVLFLISGLTFTLSCITLTKGCLEALISLELCNRFHLNFAAVYLLKGTTRDKPDCTGVGAGGMGISGDSVQVTERKSCDFP